MVKVGSNASGHKTTAENTAKVGRRRAIERASHDVAGRIPPLHRNHLIPQRQLDLDDVELIEIGQLLAGVEDFKVLRGSTAVLALHTSTEFAHLLTDASLISRGSLLVVQLYQVKRSYVFGNDGFEDDTEDADDDAG